MRGGGQFRIDVWCDSVVVDMCESLRRHVRWVGGLVVDSLIGVWQQD